MLSLKHVQIDEAMRSLTSENVSYTETDPGSEHEDLMYTIQRLLAQALPENNENRFTVVIDVQGGSDVGRIVQLAVIDAMNGPLII